MPPSRSSPRATTLLLALLASTATASPSRLFARQQDDTCLPNFDKCPNAPAAFCCPTGRTCLLLAAGTTLLCCPAGDSCAKIETISCDISRQDASTDQNSRIKTTALDSVLPRCGPDACCPFGYSCAGDNRCVLDKDQSIPPPPPPPASSTTSPTPTATPPPATPTPPPTTNGAASPEPTPTPSGSGNSTPSPAIIAGITIGALIAVASAILIAFLLIRRNNRPNSTTNPHHSTSGNLKRTPSSTSSFGNFGQISAPIPSNNTPVMRSDFSRRDIVPAPLSARNLTPPSGRLQPPPAYASSPPRTPPNRQQVRRQPSSVSSVSIDVFADPMALTPESERKGRRPGSGMTTFTALMDEADLGGVARGEGFVPYRPGTAGTVGAGGSPGRGTGNGGQQGRVMPGTVL